MAESGDNESDAEGWDMVLRRWTSRHTTTSMRLWSLVGQAAAAPNGQPTAYAGMDGVS